MKPTKTDTDAAIEQLLAVAQAAGVTPEQLAARLLRPVHAECPTVAKYLPSVENAVTPGARKTYRTYWLRFVAQCGTSRLDEVRSSDLKAFANATQDVARTTKRSNARSGVSARESSMTAYC
jgi:hypothetical protein